MAKRNIAPFDKAKLLAGAMARQNEFIDQNMRDDFLSEMYKWTNLADCEIALNYYNFRVALWAEWAERKEAESLNYVFETMPETEYSYKALEAEYIANR